MDSFPLTTKEIILSALAGLVFGCIFMGLVYSASLAITEHFGWASLALGALVSVVGYIVGAFTTLVYGVPAYVYLLQINRANYLTVVVAGGIPGLVLYAWSSSLPSLIVLSCGGIGTSVATHFLVKRRVFQSYRQRI